MALVLHVGGVGECVRLIWEWSVHNQESGDLHSVRTNTSSQEFLSRNSMKNEYRRPNAVP
jgi:hypothetical protein